MMGYLKNVLIRLKTSLQEEETLKSEETYNRELIGKIVNVLSVKELDLSVKDPVNRLRLMSTYTENFNELTSNVVNRRSSRNIYAVNVNAYFKRTSSVSYDLERLLDILEKNPVSKVVEHDLYEIVTTLEDMTNV